MNGATGTSDIEGKAAMVAATERGSEGVSIAGNFLLEGMLFAGDCINATDEDRNF